MNLNELAELINANKRYFRIVSEHSNRPLIRAELVDGELHLKLTFRSNAQASSRTDIHYSSASFQYLDGVRAPQETL